MAAGCRGRVRAAQPDRRCVGAAIGGRKAAGSRRAGDVWVVDDRHSADLVADLAVADVIDRVVADHMLAKVRPGNEYAASRSPGTIVERIPRLGDARVRIGPSQRHRHVADLGSLWRVVGRQRATGVDPDRASDRRRLGVAGRVGGAHQDVVLTGAAAPLPRRKRDRGSRHPTCATVPGVLGLRRPPLIPEWVSEGVGVTTYPPGCQSLSLESDVVGAVVSI